MSAKSGSRELFGIAIGALGLFIAFFTVISLRGDRDPATQIAFKEKRIALVNAMRVSLAAASEAQNSIVMATGEQDSKAFAEEARSATAALERGRIELEQLLKDHPGPHEVELLARVNQSLHEFQQIDQQLRDLATQNSNRKAFSLAFGPAMTLLEEMDGSLSRIADDDSGLSAEKRVRVVQLASEVRVGILRMQVLLSPHIAEASDPKMDELEQQLSALDQKARENFAALKNLLPENDQAKIEKTMAHYAEFETLKSQIIKLSRDNTDLKAVAIALKEKRKSMLACQDALAALEHAIQTEPITSPIPSGRSRN